jgi:hypothetical protein
MYELTTNKNSVNLQRNSDFSRDYHLGQIVAQ